MKIEQTRRSMMDAWMMASNALDTIKHTLMDNKELDQEARDAYYRVMKEINDWCDEIKQLPD